MQNWILGVVCLLISSSSVFAGKGSIDVQQLKRCKADLTFGGDLRGVLGDALGKIGPYVVFRDAAGVLTLYSRKHGAVVQGAKAVPELERNRTVQTSEPILVEKKKDWIYIDPPSDHGRGNRIRIRKRDFGEAQPFENGYARLRVNGGKRWTLIDRRGEFVFSQEENGPRTFEDIQVARTENEREAFFVKEAGEWGILSATGEFMTPRVWNRILPLQINSNHPTRSFYLAWRGDRAAVIDGNGIAQTSYSYSAIRVRDGRFYLRNYRTRDVVSIALPVEENGVLPRYKELTPLHQRVGGRAAYRNMQGDVVIVDRFGVETKRLSGFEVEFFRGGTFLVNESESEVKPKWRVYGRDGQAVQGISAYLSRKWIDRSYVVLSANVTQKVNELGVVDSKGRVVVPFSSAYTELKAIPNPSANDSPVPGYAVFVRKYGSWVPLVIRDGQTVEARFGDFESVRAIEKVKSDAEGRPIYKVTTQVKEGIVNFKGEWLSDPLSLEGWGFAL